MAKKALLVGINDYRGAGDLRGCVNDVLDMHFSLRSLFGFETEHIRVLTDRRATKANIIGRLEWLVDEAKAGDSLVFHFSGHGSQIRDRDEDELDDHLDELICPHDMDWDGNFITDDDLNKICGKVPEGTLLEVFLDCCHSGTGLREMGIEPPPELAAEHPTLNRYLPPPADIFLRFSGEEDKLKPIKRFMNSLREDENKHHILWAGCMANQTSADAYIGERYHGAFTYYLNQHLRRDPCVSRDELLRKVRASLRHGGYSQIPQLEMQATNRSQTIFVNDKIK